MTEFNPKVKTFTGSIQSTDGSEGRFSKSVRLKIGGSSKLFIHTLLSDLKGDIISRNGRDPKDNQSLFETAVSMQVGDIVEIQAFQTFHKELYGIYNITRLNN